MTYFRKKGSELLGGTDCLLAEPFIKILREVLGGEFWGEQFHFQVFLLEVRGRGKGKSTVNWGAYSLPNG